MCYSIPMLPITATLYIILYNVLSSGAQNGNFVLHKIITRVHVGTHTVRITRLLPSKSEE